MSNSAEELATHIDGLRKLRRAEYDKFMGTHPSIAAWIREADAQDVAEALFIGGWAAHARQVNNGLLV